MDASPCHPDTTFSKNFEISVSSATYCLTMACSESSFQAGATSEFAKGKRAVINQMLASITNYVRYNVRI